MYLLQGSSVNAVKFRLESLDLDITVEGEVRAIDDKDPLEVGEGQVVDGGNVEQGGGVPGAGGMCSFIFLDPLTCCSFTCPLPFN